VSKATKGSIEAEVSNASARFQREQHGRGPKDVRAMLNADVLLVRSTGIFTPIEESLMTTEEGRNLIKSARRELRSISMATIESELGRLVDAKVLRSYYDVDVTAGEQIEVYVLDQDLEKRLLRLDLDAYREQAPRRIR
jgi:uncharacterized protein YbcI